MARGHRPDVAVAEADAAAEPSSSPQLKLRDAVTVAAEEAERRSHFAAANKRLQQASCTADVT